MDRMSFGTDAGHLMERLLEHAGTRDAGSGVVLLQPEADGEALELLAEAARGGWIVELLDADDEPGTGEGDTIQLAQVTGEEVGGYTLTDDGQLDGGWLRLALSKVDKIHVF